MSARDAAPPPVIHPYYPPRGRRPGDSEWESWVAIEALVRCVAEHLAFPQPCPAHWDAARQAAAARSLERGAVR